jgi:hypothetical protein
MQKIVLCSILRIQLCDLVLGVACAIIVVLQANAGVGQSVVLCWVYLYVWIKLVA